MTNPRLLAGALATTVVAASFLAAAPVLAATETPDADRVADLIESVAPHQGDVLNSFAAEPDVLESSAASIPRSSSGLVILHGPDQGDALRLDVPAPPGAQATMADDGTVVYAANAPSNTAIQALEGGSVRMQTVIASSSDAHRFSYQLMNGYVPTQRLDGTWAAVKVGPEGELLTYDIAAPWARDANGAEVPTRYEESGTSLIQVVEPTSSTVYPVVADPTWKWSGAVYGLQFTKKETSDLANLGSAAAFCAALGKWPPLTVGCTLVGASWFAGANVAKNNGACIILPTVPPSIAPLQVNKKNCS